MTRVILVSTVCLLAYGLLAGAGSGIALLPDVMPWPSAYGAAVEMELADHPLETDIRFASRSETLYGWLTLGNGSDRILSVAFEGGACPMLWVDANNNENLLDDGSPYCTDNPADGMYTWIRTVLVSYESGSDAYEAPYTVRIIALRSDAGWSLYYYSFCLRRGLVRNQGMPYTIWLGDMNSDGVYSDLDSLLVIVDADRDGMPSIDYSIAEYFYPGFPLETGQFHLAGQVYDIEQVSPDGAALESAVRDMSAHEPLPWVVVGEPAPGFTLTTLQGDVMTSESLLGRAVILFFTPEVNGADCPECITAHWESQSRLCELASSIEGTDAVMLVISTTDQLPEEGVVTCHGTPVPVISDDDLLRAYRPRLHWLVLIGRDGTVLGKDSVRPVYDSQGRVIGAENVPLRVSEILRLMQSDDRP